MHVGGKEVGRNSKQWVEGIKSSVAFPNANVKDRLLCLSFWMLWFLHSGVLKIYAQQIQCQSGASHHGMAQLDTKSILQ